MPYSIEIERNGRFIPVGSICEAKFQYDADYLVQTNAVQLSVSFPLQLEPFTTEKTKCFFDGLLPEGFSRKSVADWMHVSEDDYLSLLAGLGKECLGAILVTDDKQVPKADYRELVLDEVKALAAEGALRSAKIVTESHLSLAGASGKVGLYYEAQSGKWFQPYGTAPSTHIVKQSHVRFKNIVVNELLCLRAAKKCGISVPECFILETGRKDDSHILFATQRYDRVMSDEEHKISGLTVPLRLHQEDFAQAMGISSSKKYEPSEGSYLKGMFDTLTHCSSNPIEDRLKLWDMVVFNFLIGNTDSHIKNHSLLYNSSLTGVRLAPAYDIISTTAYESCTRKLPMRLGNAIVLDDVNRDSFLDVANEVGIGRKIAMEHFDIMVNSFELKLSEATKELAAEGFETASSLKERILKTGGYGLL